MKRRAFNIAVALVLTVALVSLLAGPASAVITGGEREVSLTRAIPAIVSISVSPSVIDFGQVWPSDCSSVPGGDRTITISNTGNCDVTITTSIVDEDPGRLYTNSLTLDGVQATSYIAVMPVNEALQPVAQVCVPADYRLGMKPGTIIFWAEAIDEPPTCTIVSPPPLATVSGTITIQVEAADDWDAPGSLSVLYGIDAAPSIPLTYNGITGYYEANWDTTTVGDGPHAVNASATDSAAQTTPAAPVSVEVDNIDEPPVVEITSPLADEGFYAGDQVLIQAHCTDDWGIVVAAYAIDSLDPGDFTPMNYQSGTPTDCIYSVNWDTTGAAPGPHVIYVSAQDTAAQAGLDSVSVIIANISGVTGEVNCDILPFATVELYKEGLPIDSTTSDENGNYSIAIPEPGDYDVAMS